MDEFLSFIIPIIFLGLLIYALVVGLIFLVPVTIVVLVAMLAYSHFSPASKKNLEKAEIAETHQLYKQAQLLSPLSPDDFVEFVIAAFDSEEIGSVAVELYKLEGFVPPDPPPPIVTGVEGGRYRDKIKRYINTAHNETAGQQFMSELYEILKPFDDEPNSNAFFEANKYISHEEIDDLVQGFFGEHQFFKQVRKTLNRNYDEQNNVLPRDYKGENCPWDYLKDTPLLPLERKSVGVNWLNRAAHTLILAGTGAGKTTLFKHMIGKLLQEDCSIVVMDSQTELIEELAMLQLEDEAVTWISPAHQLALNPFDVEQDYIRDEAVINNKISLLEFVVEHLIVAPMTPRQKNLFYHCCQLIFTIPGGNVDTFKDILADPYEFANFIDQLDETSKKFFNTELIRETGSRKKGSYDSTREELSYRLDGLTKQTTFRRIFQTEENTFDFYQETLERKLILIDTNVGLLSDDSPTFGRLFVAQALQACFQRVKNKATERPVYFFIDEAHEIFDEKLERMLLQARKANVGMVLATQDFSKATKAGITDTLVGSTATKIISQVGLGDAKRLAPRMSCSADYLTSLQQFTFGFASGKQDTVSIQATSDPLEDLEQRSSLKEFREEMEYHYGPETDEGLSEPGHGEFDQKPTGKYGPNDELKPQPSGSSTKPSETKPNTKQKPLTAEGNEVDEKPSIPPKNSGFAGLHEAMRQKEDDDIEPEDEL